MPTSDKLTVHLSAVTPLFLGGAEPNERAELRPPSIKGLLRYWYRALDGEHPTWERRLFGSTDTGQAPCLLSVSEWREGTQPWERSHYSRPFNPSNPHQGGFQRGGGRSGQNGLVYLGFSLTLPPNNRKALSPGEGLTIAVLPRPQQSKEWDDRKASKMRRAWLAGLWLLVHVGGVGTRSRRGLGSLRIEEWDGWSECDELPLPSNANAPQEWLSRLEKGLGVLRQWFPREPGGDQTAVKQGARFHVLQQGHPSWESALDDAGLRLQQFRQRKLPDYSDVKVCLNGGALATGPERAGFGLPLTFRYGSLNGASVTFAGTDHGRMASPLLIRVLRLGNQYHAAFIHLPAPLLPGGERVKGRRGNREVGPLLWHPNARAIIQEFLDTKVKPDALEVTL